METAILITVLNQLPIGVTENEWGVLIGVPSVFEYEGRQLRVNLRAIFYQGSWIGDTYVMGREWGASGPTMLALSDRFPTLTDFIEHEFLYIHKSLDYHEQSDAKRKLIKYYTKWKSQCLASLSGNYPTVS